MKKWFAIVWLVLHATLVWADNALDTLDLPACSELTTLPGQEATYRIGVAAGNEQALGLMLHVATLGRLYDNVLVCQESWSAVLPALEPWSPVATPEHFYGWAIFALAVLLWFGALAVLTPTGWWRKPTLLGLAVMAGGAWVAGCLLLALGNGLRVPQKWFYGNVVSLQRGSAEVQWFEAADARALDRELARMGLTQQLVTGGVTLGDLRPQPPRASAGQTFRVGQTLHLREAAGIDARLLATLAASSRVEFLGQRQGDWWRVKTLPDGIQGWVSSLWLRQLAEN